MNIQTTITLETYKDIDKLATLVKQGEVRIAPMAYKPEADRDRHESDLDHYYLLQPEEGLAGATIRVKGRDILSFCDMLSATISVNLRGATLTFTPQGLSVNGKRHVRFKYEQDMVYRLQKTQYRGESPYGLLRVLVDPFWEHVISYQLTKIGYIAVA